MSQISFCQAIKKLATCPRDVRQQHQHYNLLREKRSIMNFYGTHINTQLFLSN